jgi:hypothetical protein
VKVFIGRPDDVEEPQKGSGAEETLRGRGSRKWNLLKFIHISFC